MLGLHVVGMNHGNCPFSEEQDDLQHWDKNSDHLSHPGGKEILQKVMPFTICVRIILLVA